MSMLQKMDDFIRAHPRLVGGLPAWGLAATILAAPIIPYDATLNTLVHSVGMDRGVASFAIEVGPIVAAMGAQVSAAAVMGLNHVRKKFEARQVETVSADQNIAGLEAEVGRDSAAPTIETTVERPFLKKTERDPSVWAFSDRDDELVGIGAGRSD